jgi:hypothetical protein
VPLGRNRARPSRTVRAWRCSATTLLGEPTAGNGGSPTRRGRRGTTAMGERRVRRSGWHGGGPGDGVVREAVGATAAVREATRAMARSARWSGRRRRAGGGRRERGRLSGRTAWRMATTWQRHAAAWARSSVISELKSPQMKIAQNK